jgi:ketosteroid isomerase-like protein
MATADRASAPDSTRATVERFNAAFNRHDVPAVMALMTDDCRFEDTQPAPDGTPYVGQAAVRECWRRLFSDSPQATFTAEEIFVCGDRAVVRWQYDWGTGHVRGVDVLRVRDGKVAEKLAYVKG